MKYHLRFNCKYPGCEEWGSYGYSTKKEYNEAVKRQTGINWKCIRHSDDRLLTLEKRSSTVTIIAGKSKKYPKLSKLFWNDQSGFAYGNSWKAFADDFPEGTKIIETVKIILPGEED